MAAVPHAEPAPFAVAFPIAALICVMAIRSDAPLGIETTPSTPGYAVFPAVSKTLFRAYLRGKGVGIHDHGQSNRQCDGGDYANAPESFHT
jgi:hypothetical protein